jgi:glucose-6-phosphate 1-dehydrogenase
VRRDELEQAWAWIDQIHTAWSSSGSQLSFYPAGSAGPSF